MLKIVDQRFDIHIFRRVMTFQAQALPPAIFQINEYPLRSHLLLEIKNSRPSEGSRPDLERPYPEQDRG